MQLNWNKTSLAFICKRWEVPCIPHQNMCFHGCDPYQQLPLAPNLISLHTQAVYCLLKIQILFNSQSEVMTGSDALGKLNFHRIWWIWKNRREDTKDVHHQTWRSENVVHSTVLFQEGFCHNKDNQYFLVSGITSKHFDSELVGFGWVWVLVWFFFFSSGSVKFMFFD